MSAPDRYDRDSLSVTAEEPPVKARTALPALTLGVLLLAGCTSPTVGPR